MKNVKFYLCGLFVILVLFMVAWSGVMETTELRALDLFRTPHSPHPDIVIVAIDNKSIQEVGRWPWDRSVHARLLNILNSYRSRLVAFDINFSEKQSDIDDSALSLAIENVVFPVILSVQGIHTNNSPEPVSVLKPVIKSGELGHVNVEEDSDGFIRKFPAAFTIGNEVYSPISFKITELVGASAPEKKGLLVDFAGDAGTFQTISYIDILERKIDAEMLKDKIVVIGATASDLHDTVLAPVRGEIISGVEWHANVVDNILLSKFIKKAPDRYYIALGLLLWSLFLFLPLSIKTINVSKLFALAALGLPASSFALWQMDIAFPFFTNLVGLTLVFVTRSFYKWYQTEMERRKLHKTIQYRFSPQVVEAIMRDPRLLKLGGERKEVTVLFSDIRSFTSISESTDPEILSSLLHEYFTEMTEEVLSTDGVLDKFIGDAVMAFWGAPFEQVDQADRALKAALGMLARLKVLQKKWRDLGWPFVDIGIGIHFGIATVGNMGSEKRFDYTVIGDTVNTASRLEGLNKEYKTHLIISEATLDKLTNKVNARPLGSVIAKGKTEEVKIYEISP